VKGKGREARRREARGGEGRGDGPLTQIPGSAPAANLRRAVNIDEAHFH